MKLLKDDPNFKLDLSEARSQAYQNMKETEHGKAKDDDQWITNKKVYKQVYNYTGFSKSNMIDATPIDRFWDQWICWNAVVENLLKKLWWLNHPWSKHQEFLPWAFE
jgi:hypothetical protein